MQNLYLYQYFTPYLVFRYSSLELGTRIPLLIPPFLLFSRSMPSLNLPILSLPLPIPSLLSFTPLLCLVSHLVKYTLYLYLSPPFFVFSPSIAFLNFPILSLSLPPSYPIPSLLSFTPLLCLVSHLGKYTLYLYLSPSLFVFSPSMAFLNLPILSSPLPPPCPLMLTGPFPSLLLSVLSFT